MFASGQWGLLALALYVHGGLLAFQPQRHEFSHGTVFRTKWLNALFGRIFGLIHWPGNSALYKMSHNHHHRYTLHKRSDGEVVLPINQTTEVLLRQAATVVDVTGLLTTLYDQVYFLFKPFLRNPRRSPWERYVYAHSPRSAQRDLYWTHVSQLLFHVLFAAAAVATHHAFLIVLVTLHPFYGGKWYAKFVHDTMHAGRQSETDDFRFCCRSVSVDPITSFLYWRMEYHTEHHAFAAVPCYRAREFFRRTRDQWDRPQTLIQAWREMNERARKQLYLPT
jgi:fatty acid desaturase